MTTPLLTVVICTHNRAALLARTLASLHAALRPAQGVQLLVVANHCSDGTQALLQQQSSPDATRLPLQWLAEPRKGKSHALNTALAALQTPLAAFVDDDQRVDAHFLQAICDAAQALPQADMWCGRLLPDWDGSEPRWVHDQGRYRIYPLPVPHYDLGASTQQVAADGELPSGGNIVVRTPFAQRVGPFSTELGPVGHDLGGAEDSEWFLRALALGGRLFYVPAIVQRHHIDAERLALGYLLRLTCKRTAAAVHVAGTGGKQVPGWVYRKLAGYAARALTALNPARRRFYLMRCAAALGEIQGYRR